MLKWKPLFLRITILFGFILVIYISWSVYKEIEKKKSIQAEIEKLQNEAEKISQENFDISEKISYLESQDYKEREAKEKLNLKSPDENVVVLKPSPLQKEDKKSDEHHNDTREIINIETKKSNPQKWWEYFFSY